ncbi:MAG: hypothetical protein GY839_00715 [candidate division Zixibacteria bacterium]|nr:hypothetical protein [candidate division Zixibacteria bacterium]
MQYSKDKIRSAALILAVALLAVALASCVKDIATDPGIGYTAGMIAYTAYADSTQSDLEVYFIDIENYSPEIFNISNMVTNDYYPVWLNGRSAIAYISSTDIQSSIYKVNPLTLDQSLLLSCPEIIQAISASPTSAQLAYLHTIPGESLLALNLLYTGSLDTLRLNEVSQTNNPVMAWSDDGSKLAVNGGIVQVFEAETGRFLYPVNTTADYMAWDLGAERLYVVRSGDLFEVDTLTTQTIISGYGLTYPAISPDRRYLAAISQSRGNELGVIDLSFGTFEGIRLVEVPQTVRNDSRLVSWAPNSRELAFIDLENGRWNIYRAEDDFGWATSYATDDLTLKKAVNW